MQINLLKWMKWMRFHSSKITLLKASTARWEILGPRMWATSLKLQGSTALPVGSSRAKARMERAPLKNKNNEFPVGSMETRTHKPVASLSPRWTKLTPTRTWTWTSCSLSNSICSTCASTLRKVANLTWNNREISGLKVSEKKQDIQMMQPAKTAMFINNLRSLWWPIDSTNFWSTLWEISNPIGRPW